MTIITQYVRESNQIVHLCATCASTFADATPLGRIYYAACDVCGTTSSDADRAIVYDRDTKDYELYLDGDLVGYSANYADGERVLDQLIAERLSRTSVDARLAQLKQLARDAKAAGATALLSTYRVAYIELSAQQLGMTVDEFMAEYAAWKQQAA